MLNLKDFEWLTFNSDNDRWFYNTGCQYPLVCPKGTKVKFIGVYVNFYGYWFEVEYEGRHYYVWPSLVDGNVLVKRELKHDYWSAPSSSNWFYVYTDRFGKQYKLLNDEGDLESI